MQQHQSAMQRPRPAAWNLYFPEDEYSVQDRRAMLVDELCQFFVTAKGWELLVSTSLQGDKYVAEMDFEALRSQCSSADLLAALDMQPVEGLACLAAAAYEVLFSLRYPQAAELLGDGCQPQKVVVRLHNHPETVTHIRLLKSGSIGRLVTIRGTVVRISPVRPLITELEFACGKCSSQLPQRFPDGKYTPPLSCGADGCRGKTFAPNRLAAKSVDWQKIRVQELVNADKDEEGRVPRTVEVELLEDLVDSCTAGDVVTVLGVVKVINTETEAGGGKGKGNKQCLFLLYLDAVSVIVSRRATKYSDQAATSIGSAMVQSMTNVEEGSVPPNVPAFTLRDLQFVIKFTEEFEKEQFKHLVHALCPAIYGNELVKAGILLALFGGVRKNVGNRNKVPVRGDIHVLIVGDPGLGKSQLLQAAAAAAPRGLYICGNTSTSAGLTVAIVRDAVTGDYAFEAGALVLADRGVCCVDEFDKMTADHQALLGAMEQQEVSVAKAGIVASLPARTAVVAAANPVGGHYTRAKTVHENLKMSSAMLSRFDLIFILLDRPDEARDQRLSEHVMALHSGKPDRAMAARQRLLEHRPTQHLLTDGSGAQPPKQSLAERLKMYSSADDGDPLPTQLLRRYIAYARQHVHPVLSEEAKAALRDFYLELRQNAAGADGTPVTTRQLESLVRMAEARARLELRPTATRQDAEDVIEIMKEAMRDTFSDSYGCVDFRRGPRGAKGKQAEAKRFLGALARRGQLEGKTLFHVSELYAVADDLELAVNNMSDFISELNDAGELLKKGSQQYQISSVASAASQAQRGQGYARRASRSAAHSQQYSQDPTY